VVSTVTEADLPELLPLMRGYCDFYHSTPSDEALLTMSRALIEDPEREGVQFLARDDADQAIGFATLFWTWQTNCGGRIGVMNDLFVAPEWRGQRAADELIAACRDRCARRGALRLEWVTAPDNLRAQAVYDRVGATREQWVDYWLPVQ
jgi:RimJ/RimL family protein N-acetyltransferase